MNSTAAKVMVVAQESCARAILVSRLQAENYIVSAEAPAEGLCLQIINRKIDFLVIDQPPQAKTNHLLVRRLRSNSRIGITVLVGDDNKADRILGLENGVDFYMLKPYGERELLLRIRNLLHRILQQPEVAAEPMPRQFGDWTMDDKSRRLVSPRGESIWLSAVELELLIVLIETPRKVIDRAALMKRIKNRQWQPQDRYIDVLVSQIRKKLHEFAHQDDLIQSVYGGGYMFSPAPMAVNQ